MLQAGVSLFYTLKSFPQGVEKKKQKVKKFSTGGATFPLRVAGNLSKNRLDYNARRSTDELKEELAAQGREDLSFVWEAVKQLPQEQRACIHLFYYEGYPTRDVARMLGRKESTIRSDLRRAREKLKKLLKEAYDFEGTV